MGKPENVRCQKTGIIFDVNVKRIFVDDVKKLTKDQIEALECGDMVIKEDSTGKHTYTVTFKKDDTGICFTYFDATYLETISYDLIDGVWTYNSTDSNTV